MRVESQNDIDFWNFAFKIALPSGGTDVDFVTFFSNYSAIIYDWLLYSLYSEKINDGQLSRKECGENIGIDKELPVNEALKDLKTRLKNSAQSLKFYQKQTNFKAFKSQLSTLGLNKNSTYLFVRGHDLFERVTMPLVKSIGDEMTKNRFQSFKIAQDTEGAKNYAHFLKNNTYAYYLKYQNKFYKEHFLFKKIILDLKIAFEP